MHAWVHTCAVRDDCDDYDDYDEEDYVSLHAAGIDYRAGQHKCGIVSR